jgi:hypothetical protein
MMVTPVMPAPVVNPTCSLPPTWTISRLGL